MISIKDKEKCCACGACQAACKKNAIAMVPDAFGNVFPQVDSAICVRCGACVNVCQIEKTIKFHACRHTLALVLSDGAIMNSASGGAFYGFASSFLKRTNGVVYGCAYDDDMIPKAFKAKDVDDLRKLQGSKYSMSIIGVSIFNDIKKTVNRGVKVLFSGVPCQCEAVRNFVGNNDNLFTIELLCHGFISTDYWKDYVSVLEEKHKGKLIDFAFRCKDKKPFVAKYTVTFEKEKRRALKHYYVNPSTSYYYENFLQGKIYRENCYHCRFAKPDRASDVTIGDYWGFEGDLDKSKGVSLAIVNTKRGEELFQMSKDSFHYEESELSLAMKNNGQLNRPVDVSRKDYRVLQEWKEKGAKYQNRVFVRKHRLAYIASLFGVFK